MRISKEPDIRRQEFIDTAMKLFIEKGYDNTAVSDIVGELNVAQGTFYYYFKSKTEILEEGIKKSILSLIEDIREIINVNNDPVLMLNAYADKMLNFGRGSSEITAVIHKESNIVLHDKLSKIMADGMIPLMDEIVKLGIAKKSFVADYFEETSRLLYCVLNEIFHDPGLLRHSSSMRKLCRAIALAVTRILGLGEGEFKFGG